MSASPDAVAGRNARPRLDSLDLLRGLVMVLMALDHSRDYFAPSVVDGQPTDPELVPGVSLGLFATRWITHFCAPVFVFLAGTSAWLYGSRGRSRGQICRFLVIRGLWLVLLEWTVIQMAWMFTTSIYPVLICQVIWAIGVSMVALGVLVWLPRTVIAVVALGLIAGHNLTDGMPLEQRVLADLPGPLPGGATLWAVLHVPGFLILPFSLAAETPAMAFVRYPLVPWIGVMAAGYLFGALMQLPEERRRRRLLSLGLGALALFLLLRGFNLYGDPRPWAAGDSFAETLVAFLNTQKYPPSLHFLLMTLGPAITALALFGPARSALSKALVHIGRVPLFFYVAHIYLIHAASWIYGALRFGTDQANWITTGAPPEGYDQGLWTGYAAWVAVVLLLYPACRWFAGVKQRHKHPALSYL